MMDSLPGTPSSLRLDGHRVGSLVDKLKRVKIDEIAVGQLLEQGARRAQQRGFDVRAGQDEEKEQARQRAEDRGVAYMRGVTRNGSPRSMLLSDA